MSAPAPISHPLGPPVVSGNNITVDTMLNQPTRITKMIMDLTLQRFVADRVFASGGGVSGGAVIYDRTQANELYASRDVEKIRPATEFPVIDDERLAPGLAEVEKWGGKVYISDEAKERNNSTAFTNRVRRLANTVVRKINQRAIAVLDASIASSGQTFAGRDWTDVTPYGATPTSPQNWPARDFLLADQMAEQDELGITYDLVLLNPEEMTNLGLIYGQNLEQFFRSMNKSVYVSNRVPAGKAYFLAERQVGEMRVEKPLYTKTWEDADGREVTWVQSGVRPVMFADNDFAVLEVTGLQG